MLYYIVTLIQDDGEHEHNQEFVAKAKDYPTLTRRIEREQLYEAGEHGHENSMLDYRDGTTAVYKYHAREIPQSDFEFLHNNNYMSEV